MIRCASSRLNSREYEELDTVPAVSCCTTSLGCQIGRAQPNDSTSSMSNSTSEAITMLLLKSALLQLLIV